MPRRALAGVSVALLLAACAPRLAPMASTQRESYERDLAACTASARAE